VSTDAADLLLRRAYAASLASLDLESRTRAALVGTVRPKRRVLIVAAGKAVAPMASGAVAHCEEHSIAMKALVVARPTRAKEIAVSVRDVLARTEVRIDEFGAHRRIRNGPSPAR
jgi:glycerate-2-kinase